MRYSLSLCVAAFCLATAAAAAGDTAPATKPDKATYIPKEEVDQVSKAEPDGDRNIRVVDIGHENFAVGIVHRGKTVNGKMAARASMKLPPPKPCGQKADKLPDGGYPAGIIHDVQTEGYYIVSGGGTMYTDGYIVNGGLYDLKELNGPTCIGTAYNVTVRTVKEGDIVIIPAGVVHGWLDIPDHVDYLSFRPSPGILEAGWVNPAIAK